MTYLPLFYLLRSSVTEEKMQEFRTNNNSITFPTKEGDILINFNELVNRSIKEIKQLPKQDREVARKTLDKWK